MAEIRLWRRISKTLNLIISGLRNLGVRLFGGRVFLGRKRTGPSLSRSVLAGRKPWPKPSESLLNAIRLDNYFRFQRPPDFGADPRKGSFIYLIPFAAGNPMNFPKKLTREGNSGARMPLATRYTAQGRWRLSNFFPQHRTSSRNSALQHRGDSVAPQASRQKAVLQKLAWTTLPFPLIRNLIL